MQFILGKTIKAKVYVNQWGFVSDIQLLNQLLFLLFFASWIINEYFNKIFYVITQ